MTMPNTDPRAEIKNLLQQDDRLTLLRRAALIHGHYCPGLASGVATGTAGMRRLGFENTGMEELIAIVEGNNCFVDGIQLTTGCSFGNNALIYRDLGKTAVTIASRKTRTAVRLVAKPQRWQGDGASERDREATDLFRRIVKERQDDPAGSARLRALWTELCFEMVVLPEEELFAITPVPAVFPEYAPIHASATCRACGESFMESHGTLREGQPICAACAEMDVSVVLGRGIRSLPGGRIR